MPCSFGNGWFAVTLNINFYIFYNYTCPLLQCKFQFHSRRIQPKHQKMPRRFFLLGQPINCLGLGRLRLSTIIFNILSTSGDSKAVRRLSFQRSVKFENRIISLAIVCQEKYICSRAMPFAWAIFGRQSSWLQRSRPDTKVSSLHCTQAVRPWLMADDHVNWRAVPSQVGGAKTVSAISTFVTNTLAIE